MQDVNVGPVKGMAYEIFKGESLKLQEFSAA